MFILLYWTPIIKWYMVRLVDNEDQKDVMCYIEIRLGAQIQLTPFQVQ